MMGRFALWWYGRTRRQGTQITQNQERYREGGEYQLNMNPR